MGVAPPPPEEFAHLVMRLVRRSGFSGEITFDAERFVLYLGQEFRVLDLQDGYAAHCATSVWSRENQMRRFVAVALRSVKTAGRFEQEKWNLVPVVKDRFWTEAAHLEGIVEGKATDALVTELCEHLTIHIDCDMSEVPESLSHAKLAQWGVSAQDAMKAAIENLRRISRQELSEVGDGVYVSGWADRLDASRLLLDDLVRGVKVRGEHVVAVPHPNVLLVTGSENPRGLVKMGQLILKHLEQSNAMSGRMFLLRPSGWQNFRPSIVHEVYELLHRAEMKELERTYERQRKLLDRFYAAEPQRPTIMNYKITVDRTNDIWRSLALWIEGPAELLLPQAEFVAFSQSAGKGPPRIFPWERVLQVSQNRLERTDLYPTRYSVRSFPAEQEFSEMGSVEF